MSKARAERSQRSTTPTDVRIGSLIRAQRRAKGLSLPDFAKAVGVASRTIEKYEKGINRVASSRLEQIAKVLNMSPSDFFERSDDPKGEFEALALLSSAPALRLLRAFNAIKSRSARYRALEIVEKMAGKSSIGRRKR
jgi:transcriptional regulator with XRE-family HTH domain